MQDENLQKVKKEEILKDIFLKEEDTLKELKEIIDLSKSFFKLEHETGDIVFSIDQNLSIKDKIILFLIGRYISKNAEVLETDKINLADMSIKLLISNTTLSKPLGKLIREGIIQKSENGEYSIIYHKIKPALKELTSEYEGGEKNGKG